MRVWQIIFVLSLKSEEKFRCVGGTDSIRLENDKQWLEILEETLNEYFRPQ